MATSYAKVKYEIGPNEREKRVFEADALWAAFRDAREWFEEETGRVQKLFNYTPDSAYSANRRTAAKALKEIIEKQEEERRQREGG